MNILPVLLSLLFIGYPPAKGMVRPRPEIHPILKTPMQDSLPPLHSFKRNDIAEVEASRYDRTITVTLKNGSRYMYPPAAWDFEDYNPATDIKIIDAIRSIRITFTKAEVMPAYPGGAGAWEKYVQGFCRQHAGEIASSGAETLTIQFVVHMRGQKCEFEISSGNPHSSLAGLAIQCIQESGDWIPATQNGHLVACYARQEVKLIPL
jgi:hypothetical protein